MRLNDVKNSLKTAVLAATILLLGVGVAAAQQQINLMAAPSGITLPDGSTVPMWGYSCGAVVTGSTATCAKLNPAATGWSPVLITVPTGQDLQINLTNGLQFPTTSGTNNIPTSLAIVGQLGGGLGTTGATCSDTNGVSHGVTCTPSPDHSNAQGSVTWPIVDTTTKGTPPTQGPRVQSFATEVTAGNTTSLTWTGLRPGTYLIESGTHPSIQGPMGLYGMLVVTQAPTGTTPGVAYGSGATTVNYNADVALLLSEIDPVQNRYVNDAVNTAGFSETAVWSGQVGACGDVTSTVHTCYPPAVNYVPLYYLINGVAFDKTNATTSLFPVSPATGVSGNVLVRVVNAGLRMHVPSIVGAQTGNPAIGGFSLIAEDGNPLPGVPRVESEVFMAAGKTYDLMINTPAAGGTALPVFDREGSLSGNGINRDAGMLAYVSVNGAGLPSAGAIAPAVARPDTYNSVVSCTTAPCPTVDVSDPAKGVIANDTNVYGVQLLTAPTGGTLSLNGNGTFSYVPNAGTTSDSFTYCANGSVTGATCSSGLTATVTLGAATVGGPPAAADDTYTSKIATYINIPAPGVLENDTDPSGYPLKVHSPSTVTGCGVVMEANGGFIAQGSANSTCQFTYQAENSQGTLSAAATVTLTFPTGNGPHVTLLDGKDLTTTVSDYRWIIEEDRTFYVNPKCTTNPLPTDGSCPTVTPQGTPAVFGTNFHTSHMPLVATGCTGPNSCESGQTVLDPTTGQHVNAICDAGNGICRPDATGTGQIAVDPSDVNLDITKRYYISVLPGDAADPFNGGDIGHGMGGTPIAWDATAGAWVNPGVTPPPATPAGNVAVIVEPTPLTPAKLSVFVFEDDFPLNGEQDGGGGIDVLSPNEPGLGGFQITLFDDAGGTGDATGQPTYDMFNMPLSNALSGTIDPVTKLDACPISANARTGIDTNTGLPGAPSPTGITGMIVTCPKYESDGTTLSPLAGQAVVANLYPGRYGVVATPAADRIARGEEWLQTNTLDGQKAHDSFLRVGEPSYFQEYGPASFHVSIGFANPKIINDRKAVVCSAAAAANPSNPCTHAVTGMVTTARNSRTPDERIYGSGSRDSLSFTQCYVSLGDPDGEDFAFTKCNPDGTFTISNIPSGDWRVVVFDQWNDQIVDGISTPVRVGTGDVNMGEVAVNQWQANIYTRTYIDQNGNGIPDRDSHGKDLEPGLPLVATNVRFRDGSFSNFNSTDLSGYAGFNEVFPLFAWYVVETDSTRYKNTGTHVVYDAGGPADGTCNPNTAPCGNSTIGQFMANTYEDPNAALPSALHVPGSYYCSSTDTADCTGVSSNGLPAPGGSGGTTGRIDPPWVNSYGWQGFAGQNSFLEFGKKPFAAGENGGIYGHVVYYSTRPFDDPALDLQLSWTPLVPHVTVNLYQEGTDPNTGAKTLKLVDTTQTSSWDDWAQGFRSDGVPNMNCPGQTTSDPFYYSLQNQPNYLDWYNSQHGGSAVTPLPASSQFKCYDGMHMWNQLQPAPYDGRYQFPSVTGMDPATGKPTGTNCTICVANTAAATTDWNYNLPMLPAGKYVVEVVVPPGYELVKEEDKNILIGDNYIAPVTQQFAGLGNVYILPDQAEVTAYNPYNAQNSTNDLGVQPRHEGDTGSVESFWPCVGQARVVPDYLSLFPQAQEVAPFAGATRNLCDRKEVTLGEQSSALAKFYIFTSTHAASHYTGIITDDFTSEFDPFSPDFGEKFAPAYLPVSVKDFRGNEIARTYADQFGAYNGMNYSTWEVNPPNPTGYAPTMMVMCMNDPGTSATPDPLFQPNYSDFCYELPFMPGQTGYFDTPVIPTSAFSEGYNHPDCNYPDATPAIKSVISSDIAGPWVSGSGAGHTLTITALGDVPVDSYAYSGPSVTTAPYNQQKVTRHYGFGSTPGTVALVGSDGVPHPLTGVSWSDTTITGTVPSGVPACAVQQQRQYGGPNNPNPERCGELVITAANGKQSIDTVTVTIGNSFTTTPHVLGAGQTIQSAIDAANPGDMIIIPPGEYNELLLMWKPVRLQGVGAASSVINANTHPAGEQKLDPWRRQVVCLFGLAINGTPISNTNPYDDPTDTANNGGPYTCPANMQGQVDRLPLEAAVGWDASLNGNLAEQLQEPSLMGAYEGAAITVLAKGVDFHGANPWSGGTIAEAGAFPTGTTLLTASSCGPNGTGSHNPFPSNFWCNPSSIDGLGIINSSQGGGGINVHGWGHNIQIANNRVHNNEGTLTGGITIGQGEHPGAYLGGAGAANSPPGSCQSSNTANLALPFCFDMNVNVHHNNVSLNSSEGDELFSSTPAGAGGVTFCTGSDYYKFNYNWVCGNLSTGDGGGLAHLGLSYSADIEHNSILFNQSTNPTIVTNGGGLLVYSAPDVDPTCGATNDKDCAPPGVGDGSGPNMLINANLILGNGAESGSGGGIRFQGVNGTEIGFFPNGNSRVTFPGIGSLSPWYTVTATNNIIVNNVAGWDGGGVSLLDSLAVNFINNTVASNDSTASSGVLFNTLFAPLASSSQGAGCQQQGTDPSKSCPQIAGLVSVPNSAALTTSFTGLTITCPTGHPNCTSISNPILDNNVLWQNRSFFIGVGSLGAGQQNQQNVVSLYDSFTTTQAESQPQADATQANGSGVIITGGTGACVLPNAAPNYWDIGVRGDTDRTGGSGFRLAPTYSVITDIADYSAGVLHNTGNNPTFVSQYCNGSRVPPELGSMGYIVNPGTNETNAPIPIFSLTPSATVDEGNNWINMRWGPLALTHPVTGTVLGNYSPAAGSSVINLIPSSAGSAYTLAPTYDFFGNARKTNNAVDAGAVEFGATAGGGGGAGATLSPASWNTSCTGSTGCNILNGPVQTFTLTNTGTGNITGITHGTLSGTNANQWAVISLLSTCGPASLVPFQPVGLTTLAPGQSCVVTVQFRPTTAGAKGPATLSVTDSAGTQTATLTGTRN
jgi:hypothetical protein